MCDIFDREICFQTVMLLNCEFETKIVLTFCFSIRSKSSLFDTRNDMENVRQHLSHTAARTFCSVVVIVKQLTILTCIPLPYLAKFIRKKMVQFVLRVRHFTDKINAHSIATLFKGMHSSFQQ
jgi:hypothetical protein